MKFLMPLRLRIASLVFAAAFAQDAMSQDMEQTPKVALQPMAQHVRQGLIETHAMLLYRADDLRIAVEEFLIGPCGARRAEVAG